jgi:signal transduction histidine kinase/HPt (histidine-containing phosphotransfer) domain-containing protein
MVLISVIFLVILTVVTVMNIISINKNVLESKKNIMNALTAKGKTLVQNNSMAMTGMAEDNAFTAIQSLVSQTVKDDDDLLYGIYMDNMSLPWVNASKDDLAGIPKNKEPLKDSISLWAAELQQTAFKNYKLNKANVIEFAAPVIVSEETMGFIRYGFSTKAMQTAIAEVQKNGRNSLFQTLSLLFLLAIISLFAGYIIVKKIAIMITTPIGALVHSTKVISEGNYDITVKAESNDEIGNLAEHFESMRATIKKYTDHLQDIIDEKMQQVNDILNNIDQGLFTINLDGTVNNEYSARANQILKVDDVASHNIYELLRLDTKQQSAFNTWLDLIKKRHQSHRWNKLVKLAPVLELELLSSSAESEMEFVAISYQKIYDKEGKLSKIMVLAADETEKRMKDLQMAAERQRHENDVKAILGIANTPPEEIVEFMEDTTSRMRDLKSIITVHLENVKEQRENFPNGPEYLISKEQIEALYRDMHTIKGNSGSYGFEMLSFFAHHAEDMLEELREPIKMRRADSLVAIKGYLDKMDESIDDIHQKIRLVFGKDEEATIRIPGFRIEKIQNVIARFGAVTPESNIAELVNECAMLSWKPLKSLVRKYTKVGQKTARKLHKNVEFIVENDQAYFPPDILADIDDVMIHLMRNAVDHGIEEPEVREEFGKGVGRVRFELKVENKLRILRISDDGRGIDSEKLLDVALKRNVISAEQFQAMSENERLKLIFLSGISTSEIITDISGRGIGMNVVQEKIQALNGDVTIETIANKGTTFIITIPETDSLKEKGLYIANAK